MDEHLSELNYIFCDLETTEKDPHWGEILTGYFVITDCDFKVINEYEIKNKPELWNIESEEIHGISWRESQTFDSPNRVLETIKRETPKGNNVFICHAFDNFNVTFDYAYLKNFFARMDCYHEFYKFFPQVKSTYSYAVYLDRRGLFSAPKKLTTVKRKDKETQQLRKTFALKPLCELFEIDLKNHHEARADTIACFELFKKLNALDVIADRSMRAESFALELI